MLVFITIHSIHNSFSMATTNISSASTMDKAVRGQAGQGLILQSYCNSVLQQGFVDFGGLPNLGPIQIDMNNGLRTAQGHATNYLNNIQPSILTNVASITNYYNLHNAIPTALPPGSTPAQWVNLLKTLESQAQQYKQDAHTVVISLQDLNTALGTDTAAFSGYVSKLNSTVGGDNGTLAGMTDQLNTMQGDIDGAIAGIAISGLAIIGGVFMIIVGSVADLVTAGTTTPLIIGGIAVVAAGIGGEVASALTLESLNKAKAKLLQQQASLKSEVKIAGGVSSAYNSLHGAAAASMTAATSMASGWTSLEADLGTLSSNLENGIMSADAARMLFLTAANGSVKSILQDTSTIKNQMAGVTSMVAPKGMTVGAYAVEKARNMAA
jgi:non-hemolytic enterotoxin B/C